MSRGIRIAPAGPHVWTDPACEVHDKPRFGTRRLHRRNRGKRCQTCKSGADLVAFTEGVLGVDLTEWQRRSIRALLAERGRRLASERDDLIAAGVDPGDLDVPLHPTPTDPHSCESCSDCLHDGAKCCGCYDGACCKSTDSETGADRG